MKKAETSTPEQSDKRSPEPRGARRKRRTRSKLMRAAMQLMAEKGVEGVAINDITEAADVGFGTFYNHFESKAAIYQALVEEVFESFGVALQQIVESIDDPAEILSASIRCTLRKASTDREWGHFLLRTGFTTQIFSLGLGHHLLRDLELGIKEGRFQIHDPYIAVIITGGAVLAAISTELEISTPGNTMQGEIQELGFDTRQAPQRISAAILRTLGIPADQAEKIARRPLPDVDFSPGAF